MDSEIIELMAVLGFVYSIIGILLGAYSIFWIKGHEHEHKTKED